MNEWAVPGVGSDQNIIVSTGEEGSGSDAEEIDTETLCAFSKCWRQSEYSCLKKWRRGRKHCKSAKLP